MSLFFEKWEEETIYPSSFFFVSPPPFFLAQYSDHHHQRLFHGFGSVHLLFAAAVAAINAATTLVFAITSP